MFWFLDAGSQFRLPLVGVVLFLVVPAIAPLLVLVVLAEGMAGILLDSRLLRLRRYYRHSVVYLVFLSRILISNRLHYRCCRRRTLLDR